MEMILGGFWLKPWVPLVLLGMNGVAVLIIWAMHSANKVLGERTKTAEENAIVTVAAHTATRHEMKRLATVETELEVLNRAAANSDAERQSWDSVLRNVKAERDVLRQRLSNSEEQYSILTVTCEKLEGQLAEAKRNLTTAEEQVKRQIADLEMTGSIQKTNEAARADTYQQFLQLVERERQLYSFLMTHFPNELELAQLENRSLITCACAILLKSKQSQAKGYGI